MSIVLATSAQAGPLLDEPIRNFFDRALEWSPNHHHANLDDTSLGKRNHPRRALDSPNLFIARRGATLPSKLSSTCKLLDQQTRMCQSRQALPVYPVNAFSFQHKRRYKLTAQARGTCMYTGVVMDTDDTIAAVATAVAPGQGGIAVVRVSGPMAESVGRELVFVPGKQIWASHRVLYGYVMDASGEERIDEVLLLIMKAPRSFTGEDVVEIHCHGGVVAVQRVLERVLSHPGVRRAWPGEFSQRAVLNGRMSLTQAEAINDLVGARSTRAAQLAMTGADGGIQRRITALRERLLDQMAELEARVDFGEDVSLPFDEKAVLTKLEAVRGELEQLVNEADRGAALRQGLRVALIGRPNVGKSSLLNLLSRRERAIVTNLPGTTRDMLESEIVLQGVPITLLDTAGIRATDDAIENLGIARSRQALASADVVVLVFDLTEGWTSHDAALLAQIPEGVPRILVGNKADVQPPQANTPINESTNHTLLNLKLSALTGEGEDNLIQALLQVCGAHEAHSLVMALNERQRDLAKEAAAGLVRIQETSSQKFSFDLWAIDLRQAIRSLGEITGEEITETVLDRIFSRFCIGK